MEIKPVIQTEKPKYPLKAEINDETLKKQIPKRWMHSPVAKAAMGTLAVMSLSGCMQSAGGDPLESAAITEGPVITSPNTALTIPPDCTASDADISLDLQNAIVDGAIIGKTMVSMLNVAPLFLHGEGRGAFGGMVSGPAFISEDDALAVINAAAKEYGLEFTSSDAPVFENVRQPLSDPNPESVEDPEITRQLDKIMTLQTDFADKEHWVAIEFVSGNDVSEWWQWPATSTVKIYDAKDAADQLSDSLEAAAHRELGFYTVGVLYDPFEYSGKEDSLKQSKEQLKAQAKDFFEWLKAQGVI